MKVLKYRIQRVYSDVTGRRIERLTKRCCPESVPRVAPVNSPLREPRSLPLAVLIRRELTFLALTDSVLIAYGYRPLLLN
jgi:hypothetical protein